MWKSWALLEPVDGGAGGGGGAEGPEPGPLVAGVGEPEAVAASEVFGAGAEWLKWTESVIDVDQENSQVRQRRGFS